MHKSESGGVTLVSTRVAHSPTSVLPLYTSLCCATDTSICCSTNRFTSSTSVAELTCNDWRLGYLGWHNLQFDFRGKFEDLVSTNSLQTWCSPASLKWFEQVSRPACQPVVSIKLLEIPTKLPRQGAGVELGK